MRQEQVVEIIREYINQFVNKERTEKIKKLQHSLTFELRWSELTNDEREYVRNMPHMTDEIRKRLNSMNKKQREEYLSSLARSEYFKQIAWDNYLFGFSDSKPPVTVSVKKAS